MTDISDTRRRIDAILNTWLDLQTRRNGTNADAIADEEVELERAMVSILAKHTEVLK